MSLEKEYIEKIEDVSDFIVNECESCEGYFITTNKQVIKLLIANEQSCCEKWGYLFCNDSYEEFIGKEIHSISIVDTCLVKKEMPFDYLDDGGVIFVNLETEAGTLQFSAYNCHNGWYGHNVYIESKILHRLYSV